MAVFDTHQAFETPIAAGFTERQAKALLKVGSDWSGGSGDNRYVGTDTAIGTIG